MSGEFNHGLRVIIGRMESYPADFEVRTGFLPSKWVRAVNLVLEGIESGLFTEQEVTEFYAARRNLNRNIFNAAVLDILNDDTVGRNVPAREKDIGKLQMGNTPYIKTGATSHSFDPYLQTYLKTP